MCESYFFFNKFEGKVLITSKSKELALLEIELSVFSLVEISLSCRACA